jgi:hypothetical protein
MAIASFVSGLLTWVTVPFAYLIVPTPLCAIAAIVCGHIARAQIRRNPGQEGDGFAIAGLVMGWAAFVLCLLAIFLVLAGVATILALLGLSGRLD